MQPELEKQSACPFCNSALTDAIIGFVPSDYFGAVLCFGTDDDFLIRTRVAYPDSFLMYIDEPNAQRLFKERHAECSRKLYVNPLPLNNVGSLRFDLILSKNILHNFAHNLREMIDFICYTVMTDDGYFVFCEKSAEIGGMNVVEVLSTYLTVEKEIVLPDSEIAGICRKKGIYG